jgi:lysophospholipase L1-like esterase
MRQVILIATAIMLVAADAYYATMHVEPESLVLPLTMALGGFALVFSLRDRTDAATLGRWRNRALLMLFTLAISIAFAEAATRVIFRDVTTTSDNQGYFTRRWAEADRPQINAGGFRERSFPEVKAPGTYRIAAVGDSFTYGNGIRNDERYTEILQAKLPNTFEVLNFGTAGANTPQHLHAVANVVLPLKPDFVILQWYINDVEGHHSAGRPTYHSLLPFNRLHGWLIDSSAFYAVANMQWAQWQVALGMTPTYADYLRGRMGDPNGPDAREDRAALVAVIEACRRQGVPVGMVLFPDTGAPIDANYPFGYLHDRVLETCREQGITCVDLREDFALVKDRQSLWANRLDHHPSGRANTIAAIRMLAAFSPQWLASPPR